MGEQRTGREPAAGAGGGAPGTFYDGAPYSLLFDRMLAGLHRAVAAWIGGGGAALDAGCGPGGLAFRLAESFDRVEGVDHSPRMIARAETLLRRRGLDHVSFRVGDATRLDAPAGAFDVATVAMGLHEMPADVRARVLPELLRVARRVVVCDFAVPMPRNRAGWRNRAIEVLAGPRHFAGFRDYTRRGGLPTLIEAAGARVRRQRPLDATTLLLVELERG